MFMFSYYLVWTFVILLCVPVIPLLRKRRVFERLALGLPIPSHGDGNIWIHALSVGEVISALPLVDALAKKYPDKDIVFTVTTSRGMAIARNELEGKIKALVTMPIDFWWCIRRIVNYIRPSVFILVETDIWPGLLDYLKKRRIPSILVNGRVSPRTFKSYRRFAYFTRKIFAPFEQCLMDSELDSKRLLKIGIASPEKVYTVGNIKFDRHWIPMSQEERGNWLRLLKLESRDLIWVAGSIHHGESEVLLEVFKKLHPSFSALRLIIAPRAIEQSDDILSQARRIGLNAVLKTDLSKNREHYDILILNTLGELGRIYGLSEVSFVGGSLVSRGGHNLLEPAGFGCPVLFGRHTEDFDLMSELLIEAGGGWRVKDENELYEAMKRLLADVEMRTMMGGFAKAFVEKNRGALERVMSHIGNSIDF